MARPEGMRTSGSSIRPTMARTLARVASLTLALGATVAVSWTAVRGVSVFNGPGPFLDSSWFVSWAIQAGLAGVIGLVAGRSWGRDRGWLPGRRRSGSLGRRTHRDRRPGAAPGRPAVARARPCHLARSYWWDHPAARYGHGCIAREGIGSAPAGGGTRLTTRASASDC